MIVTVSLVRAVADHPDGLDETYGRPHLLAHVLSRLVVVDA